VLKHREKTTYSPIHFAERDEKRSDRPELGVDRRTVPQHEPCVSRPRDRKLWLSDAARGRTRRGIHYLAQLEEAEVEILEGLRKRR